MKRPVLAANWKMNNGPAAAKTFMEAFLAGYAPRDDRTIIIFPPAVSLTTVATALSARSDVLSGIQNIHWAEKGAFTGETSAPMAKEAGARVALVGHSERRHVFGETDAQCAKKCLAASRAKLTFMLCVGETIQQREAGETDFEGVGLQRLVAGSCWAQPPGIRHTVVGWSDDCELLEILMPAHHETVNDP